MRIASRTDRLRHVLLAAIGATAFAPGCGAVSSDSGSGNGGVNTGGVSTGGMNPGTTGGANMGGTGTGGSPFFVCEQPAPWPTSDENAGGYVKCADGVIHRPESGACTRAAVPGAIVSSPIAFVGDCQEDVDCAEAANGFCQKSPGNGPEPGTSVCAYPCTTDSECAQGRTCSCEEQGGRCLPATCRVDGECGDEPCIRLPTEIVCGRVAVPTLSCASRSMGCRANSQCQAGHVCVAGACVHGGNSCGRPFLVQAAERRATVQIRGDWSAAPSAAMGGGLSPQLQASLCEHFTQAALMEHASIAAFARFTLELLALGAPADLVSRAAQAMADETEHARLCFALAARHGGQAVGPSALSIEGCLDDSDPVAVFSTAFREACIGETRAALEALESAEGAHEPELRATLTRIAEDEARHAELGWRFAAWMLETSDPTLRAELLALMEALVLRELEPSSFPASTESLDARLLSQHGMLAPAARAALRESALRDVVAPCVASLVRAHGAAKGKRRLAESPAPAFAADS